MDLDAPSDETRRLLVERAIRGVQHLAGEAAPSVPGWAHSARRTESYGKADWEAMKADGNAILAALAALLAAGAAPDGAEAMDAAEQARFQIDRWFYPCSHAMHALLAEGYVTDPRFTAFYDKVALGLAVFVSAAIKANARRAVRPLSGSE